MSTSISLDDLVALNDEIVGLVRSGVPLEMGLAGWGRDLPGVLGRIVTELGDAGLQGRSLADALADKSDRFPPVYRAVVTAGVRSGRLSSALESMARSARHLGEVRSAVGMAVLYPLVVLLLGYALFMFLASSFIAMLSRVYESPPPALWSTISWLGSFLIVQVPIPGMSDRAIPAVVIPPLVLVVVAATWWLRTRRAMVVGGGSAARWLGCIPVAGRVVRDSRRAMLAEIFGLLVEHDVSVAEAIVLSADCTGDKRLMRSARRAAAAIGQGATGETYRRDLHEFPPLLAWLVASGAGQRTLSAMACHIADTYRRRVARDSLWLRDFLPLWLVVAVGVVVVGAYALSIFVPFSELMDHLGAAPQSLRFKP